MRYLFTYPVFFFLPLSKAMLFRKENVDFLNDKIKLMYLKYLAVHFFH
ncbi:hypothetical protein HMPREF0367_00222 [[Eubacterium] cylindroides ATCC 27803]|uniref:Uncharacterized protein n=1 Tax=Faecalitalea cylindroides ATCC 27803 TaxID=649755 RepID=U2PSF8_9FIRM|nr:hypothetical protein HMPREF0367_00222 [[Eubacterium] cylindroides ATCC 27803] [Faecalitalea cylindroides ATCC 27803]